MVELLDILKWAAVVFAAAVIGHLAKILLDALFPEGFLRTNVSKKGSCKASKDRESKQPENRKRKTGKRAG